MIPEDLINEINQLLTGIHGKNTAVKSSSSVSGGDINSAWRIKTGEKDYFVKVNSASSYPGMFEKEAKGLKLLKENCSLKTPDVIGHGSTDKNSFLLLEYIESAGKSPKFWDEFGHDLAELHKTTAGHFGLDHDNYIGSLQQSNKQHEKWTSFFTSERLQPQLKAAYDKSLLNQSDVQAFEKLLGQLDNIFPEEPPALIHGDLWSGNYMSGPNGEPVIIDPAVYFGHREMDLGMSKLFGGFSTRFYQVYHSVFPLENQWEQRLDICNLYPLLVHVNLFGGGYVSSVRSILKRF